MRYQYIAYVFIRYWVINSMLHILGVTVKLQNIITNQPTIIEKKQLLSLGRSLFLILPFMFTTSTFASEVKPGLNVYTYDSFSADWGPGPKIKAAFEAECACTLNFVALEDGVSILNRVKLEGKYTKADILLGLDNNLMSEAMKTDLIAKHQQDTTQLSLPTQWTNEYFVPFDYSHFAFVYDSEKLKNPPKSLAELVNRDDINIIYQDPRTSTPGLGFMLWVKSLYGDNAPQAWEKLANKTVTVTKGWSQAYGMFLEGEADMVLSYTTSPAYHMIADKEFKYKAAAFSEGHYQQTEVVAQLKNAPHPELAAQFMAFVLTPAFQDVIATGNWMMPAKQAKPLPTEFDQLITPSKTLEFSSDDVASNRKSWVKEWRNAISK